MSGTVEIRHIYARDWFFPGKFNTEYRLYENGEWFASFSSHPVAWAYAMQTHPGWTVQDG